MSKVAIVLPIMNQFELAIKALDSVRTNHEWEPVIVNQWENPTSLAGAWNRGIEQAMARGAEHILISNDDVLYSPWTIDALVTAMNNRASDVVMITAMNQRGTCTVPDAIRYWPQPDPARVSSAESPDFSCFMIGRDFPKKIGLFDTNIFPSYYDDNEMHIRINVLGYKALCTTSAPYYHYGSRTQNATLGAGKPIVDGTAFMANHAYLRKKWGTDNAAELVFKFPFDNPSNDPKEIRAEWRPR